MLRNFIIILFLQVAIVSSYSQYSGKCFTNYHEYIYFLNDSLVNYKMITSISGAMGYLNKGIGKYRISSDSLIIITSSLERVELNDGPDSIPFPQKVLERIEHRTDHYKIIFTSDSRIKLAGPIVEDYEKLNRRRFIRGFFNWPWQWSFGRQHWYDPRTRNMMIKEID